jgi:peptide/nickel transport system substrate-binding protein
MIGTRIAFRVSLLCGVAALFAAETAQAQFQCPRKGGDFVFAQEAKANSLDQHVSSTISTRNIAMNVFESLMTRDENMAPIPELAAEVIESPDKKVYTFKLRQGIKFHNGKTMTSADVLASFNRYMRVGNDRGMFSIVEKYETPDPATFVMRLKQPQPTFLENLSSFSVPVVIIPSELAEAPALQLQAIGTGPYQIAEFVADSHARLRRFDGYQPDTRYKDIDGFGGYKVACLDTVTFRFITEPGARVAGLETGEFHAVEDVPAKSQPRLKENRNLVLRPLENFWVQIALTNFQLPPMNNLQFRQAVQAVLDMEELMEAATDGAYKLNIGFQYPGQTYYTDVGKELYNQKNPTKAKQLLQQSGYKGEKVILLTNRDYPNMYVAATMMAEQMKSIGINAELLVLDWPATVNMYRNQDDGWHLFFTGWGTNTSLGGIAALRFLTPPLSEAYNPKTGEEDKEFLAAFDDIANGDTLEKRKAAFVRAQKRVLENVMVYPFGSLTKVQATRANVENFRPFRIPRMSNVSLKN